MSNTEASNIQNKAASILSQKRLIAVEGIDGSGKSTIVAHIQDVVSEYLKGIQYPSTEVYAFDSWSANDWTKQLRSLFVSGINDARSEMLLAFAARRALVVEKLLPHMEAGAFCVVDRFIYSTIAYQCDTVRDLELCLDLTASFAERTIPGLTVYLNADYETALGRAGQRGKLDSIEQRGELFFSKLDIGFRLGFSILSTSTDTYSIEVDAKQDLGTVKASVTEIVTRYLNCLFNLNQETLTEKEWLVRNNIKTVERDPA